MQRNYNAQGNQQQAVIQKERALQDDLLDDLANVIVNQREKVIDILKEVHLLDGYSVEEIKLITNKEIAEMVAYAIPQSKKLKEKIIRLISNTYFKSEGDNSMWNDLKIRNTLLGNLHRMFITRKKNANGEDDNPNTEELIEKVKDIEETKAEQEAKDAEILRKKRVKVVKYIGLTGVVLIGLYVGYRIYRKYLQIPMQTATVTSEPVSEAPAAEVSTEPATEPTATV